MTIESTFNIGDEVWFMHENKPTKSFVSEIILYVNRYDGGVINESYNLVDDFNDGEMRFNKGHDYWDYDCMYTDQLFRTKEELIESLINS